MSSIEEKIEYLILKPINDLGYNLYDVQYVKDGKNYFLKIFIDKDSGIDLNDCENVNNAINDLLDKADYIKEQYFLEVSSPGIERVLRREKHLQDNIGALVEIKLFKPIEKKKNLQAILKEFNKEDLVLQLEDDKQIIIQRKDVSLIKTVYNW